MDKTIVHYVICRKDIFLTMQYAQYQIVVWISLKIRELLIKEESCLRYLTVNN